MISMKTVCTLQCLWMWHQSSSCMSSYMLSDVGSKRKLAFPVAWIYSADHCKLPILFPSPCFFLSLHAMSSLFLSWFFSYTLVNLAPHSHLCWPSIPLFLVDLTFSWGGEQGQCPAAALVAPWRFTVTCLCALSLAQLPLPPKIPSLCLLQLVRLGGPLLLGMVSLL